MPVRCAMGASYCSGLYVLEVQACATTFECCKTPTRDALSHPARREKRVQVIRLRKAGQTCGQIAEQTGVSRRGVFNICNRYEAGDAAALKDAVGARNVGAMWAMSAC